MVNLPNGYALPDWEALDKDTIMLLNDLTFYIDFITVEMGKLVSGLF